MKDKIICLTDNNGRIIYEGAFSSLPLNEEYIIKKSIELFNDEEPCIIHRTYIIRKILFEVNDYFDIRLSFGTNKFPWNDLPSNITQALYNKCNVHEVIVFR